MNCLPPFSLLFILCILKLTSSQPEEEEGIVKIEAFGEARCSDTSYWMKWHWAPMYRMLESTGKINLEYHPFGIKTTCVDSDEGDDVVCDCHHGDRECVLNQLQNCVIEALPDFRDHMEVVTCIQGKQNISMAAEACFNEPSKLNRYKMVECAESQHGRKLFRAQENFAAKLAPDMDWVPWILINGKRYKEAEEDLWQFICDRFINPRPIHCPKKIVYTMTTPAKFTPMRPMRDLPEKFLTPKPKPRGMSVKEKFLSIFGSTPPIPTQARTKKIESSSDGELTDSTPAKDTPDKLISSFKSPMLQKSSNLSEEKRDSAVELSSDGSDTPEGPMSFFDKYGNGNKKTYIAKGFGWPSPPRFKYTAQPQRKRNYGPVTSGIEIKRARQY